MAGKLFTPKKSIVSYWPSSVEWVFPHLVRNPCIDLGVAAACGDIPPGPNVFYWLFTREGLDEPSDVLDFFRGCNGYSTGNPCTINDGINVAPVYAFWVQKSLQVGENLVDFVDLVYFFYYPYNRGKEVFDTIFGNHVGDWEHVTVRLMWSYEDQTGWSLRPAQMYLSAHSFGSIYDWEAIPKFNDTHPVVYSAWGSHGVWLTPGMHTYDEACHGKRRQADDGILFWRHEHCLFPGRRLSCPFLWPVFCPWNPSRDRKFHRIRLPGGVLSGRSQEFRQMLKKKNLTLPRNIVSGISEEKLEKMTDVSLVLEPLWENALGPDWKKQMTRDRIKDLYLKM